MSTQNWKNPNKSPYVSGLSVNDKTRSFMLLFGGLFTIIPLLFVGLGAQMVVKQEIKINSYQKVEALVKASTVKKERSHGRRGSGSVYTPIVTYDYDVDGQHYETSKTLVETFSTSDRSWAQSIVDRYKPGETCIAYYNPSNPQEAFLVREHSFFPYLFVLFPMIHLSIGLVILSLAMGVFGAFKPQTYPEPDGWYRMAPDFSLVNRRKAGLCFCAWWYGIGLLALGHFFLVAEHPFTPLPVITAIVYSLIGLAGVAPLLRWIKVLNEMSEPKVRVKGSVVQRGQNTPVDVELRLHSQLRIKDIQIGVLCEDTYSYTSGGKKVISTSLAFENWQTIPENANFRPGQKFKVEREIVVPASGALPLTHENHLYKWMVGVRVDVEHGANYIGKFPINIE